MCWCCLSALLKNWTQFATEKSTRLRCCLCVRMCQLNFKGLLWAIGREKTFFHRHPYNKVVVLCRWNKLENEQSPERGQPSPRCWIWRPSWAGIKQSWTSCVGAKRMWVTCGGYSCCTGGALATIGINKSSCGCAAEVMQSCAWTWCAVVCVRVCVTCDMSAVSPIQECVVSDRQMAVQWCEWIGVKLCMCKKRITFLVFKGDLHQVSWTDFNFILPISKRVQFLF